MHRWKNKMVSQVNTKTQKLINWGKNIVYDQHSKESETSEIVAIRHEELPLFQSDVVQNISYAEEAIFFLKNENLYQLGHDDTFYQKTIEIFHDLDNVIFLSESIALHSSKGSIAENFS